MRMAIIAVVALLILGGAGAGAYFYFFMPAEETASEGEEGAHQDAKKEEKHGGGHGETAEFVELDPLILPIIDNTGVSQVVSMVVSIEVDGPAAAEQVKKLSPRLKDAYIQDMYGVLNEHAALKGGVIQVDTIKKRLNKLTADVLGEGIAHDVLLQVVQQRPI